MQMPFFSIITVCLNAGNDLKRTIESILLQDFKNFEIIIKDGFSNDNSLSEIQSNPKIKIIKKYDIGIYDAMNQALEYSNGQYVLFLNAGDYFYDQSILQSFYNSIVSNQNPSLVFCDYITTDLGVYVVSPTKLSVFFLFRTMLCHQVCMIRRDSYLKLGHFDTVLKVDADYDFLLRLLIWNKSNYKHIQKLGVVSKSKGFSFKNNIIAKQEVKLLRKKYFPKYYLFYSLMYYLTFPNLRMNVANGSGLTSKLYQRLVNIFNYYF